MTGETPMAKREKRQGRISFTLSANMNKAIAEAKKKVKTVQVVGRIKAGGVLELSEADLAAIARKARTQKVVFVALNAPFKTKGLTESL
jgi:bisphosphoglycerate-independent phosphoglycerate mutase (AlkP superfamily)